MEDTQPRSLAKLATALAKAQAIMHGAKKDANNPHLESKYADLASCWDACREPLTSNGLSIAQLLEGEAPTVTVRTILLHESGEYIESAISATAKDTNPQTIGSIQTYLRRYGLSAMVGIAPEDDDGQAAQPTPATPAKTTRPTGNAMDLPPVTPDAAEEMIGKGQMIELVRHCERVFGPSPDDRLRALSEIGKKLNRLIVTRKALTAKEAAGIILGLSKKLDGEFFTQPATA